MRIYVAAVFLGHLAVFIVPVIAVPRFDIDLDQPPQLRWIGVATYYKPEIVAMLDRLFPADASSTSSDRPDPWISQVPFDAEYEAELQGFIQAANHPSVDMTRLKRLNMFYEMDAKVNLGCSDVLWASPNGNMMHGRNLDDFSADRHLVNWPMLTFDATFHRGGQPLLKMTSQPGSIGISTGMRYPNGGRGGYTFAQNTRLPNGFQDNLAAAAQGGQLFSLAVRRIMESTEDFNTAVQMMYSTKFMAPQYFCVTGSGPFEGAVLTIDRLAQHKMDSPPIQRVMNTTEAWHIVQTNDDLTSIAKDSRRPLADFLLKSSTRDMTLSEDNMLQFMHTKDLFNSATIFTSVMVPATGYYKTVLPDEPPVPVDGSVLQMQLMNENTEATLQATMPVNEPFAQMPRQPYQPQPSAMPLYGQPPHQLHSRQPRQQRRFLALRSNQPQHMATARDLKTAPDDQVSLMQLSWKLEA